MIGNTSEWTSDRYPPHRTAPGSASVDAGQRANLLAASSAAHGGTPANCRCSRGGPDGSEPM